MTNTSTGMPTVPNTPMGSRTKIFISSHVSLTRARITAVRNQLPTSSAQLPNDIAARCELGFDIGSWTLEVGSWKSGVGSWELGVDMDVYSRIECPVKVRNTSSRFGTSVLKSVTRMRCSARH